jgi:hypothetical protein
MTGSRRWSREFRAISGIDAATPADTELFTTLIHPDDRDWVNQRYRAAYDPAGDGWLTHWSTCLFGPTVRSGVDF